MTDGGANMAAAAQDLVGQNHHMVCIDHSINRMVTVATENSKQFRDL